MAIIKKDEVLPLRPVIILLYGQPGTGKTSVANTSNNPLLIDTDRGSDRACTKVDTLVADKWEDILDSEKDMEGYGTIVIDTAKACLDDFLLAYVVKQDYKLAKNKLKAFGAIADAFKDFINRRRTSKADIIFICHTKETNVNDAVCVSPDCTGSSKDLLLRIADQVGYIQMKNGKRTISFDPNDTTVGKNVAGIGELTIPDSSDEDFSTFMDSIIDITRHKIQANSAAQVKLLEQLNETLGQIKKVNDIDSANSVLDVIVEMPKAQKITCWNKLKEITSAIGLVYDKAQAQFVKAKANEADKKHND